MASNWSQAQDRNNALIYVVQGLITEDDYNSHLKRESPITSPTGAVYTDLECFLEPGDNTKLSCMGLTSDVKA